MLNCNKLKHKPTFVYMKFLNLKKLLRYMPYFFLPLLFLVPFFLAIMISCWILLSKYSCFFVNIASVSLSRWMASWGDGLDRDLCLDLELDPELELELELGLELDELEELPLNIFEILLIFIDFNSSSNVHSMINIKSIGDLKGKWQFLTGYFSDSIQNTYRTTPLLPETLHLCACKLLYAVVFATPTVRLTITQNGRFVSKGLEQILSVMYENFFYSSSLCIFQIIIRAIP